MSPNKIERRPSMKSGFVKSFIAIAALAALALALPAELVGQQPRYKLIDLGTLGGPNSTLPGPLPVAQDVNDRGVAAGQADLPMADPLCISDCFVFHAFKWQNGSMTDLGTLPGGTFSGAALITASGQVTGGGDHGVFVSMLGELVIITVFFTKVNTLGVIWVIG